MKQTAVEWLEEEIKHIIPSDFLNKFNQAKEMEKEQIIDADLNGSIRTAKGADFRVSLLRIKELAEQYYNETFNK